MSQSKLIKNVSKEQIELVDELFRKAVKKFPRRRVEIRGINDLFQADLCDMNTYTDENRSHRYILLVINCFSKYCYARPLITKSTNEVSKAMESILQEILKRKEKVNLLQTDQGTEFFSHIFKRLMKKYGIKHYCTFSHLKAQVKKF